VTVTDLERVRPQLGDRGFDVPVTVPIALLFAYVLVRFTRWIGRRFGSDERLALGAATLFASMVIPVAVLTIGSAWAGVAEIVRLGNEHIGQRARFDGLQANFVVMLGVGIIGVWTAGAVTAIRNRSR
jgi:predicted PurR-regulated permease PerM